MKGPLISFAKFSGCGNDFIVIDNRQGTIDGLGIPVPTFAKRVCARRLSVGADGLILIEQSGAVDFRWRFYNADGSEAEFCGNGARCVARYAAIKGIAGDHLRFETAVGPVQAWVRGESVRVQFPQVGRLTPSRKVDLGEQVLEGHFITTGVPHFICQTPQIDGIDLLGLGRRIRFHPDFQPKGTNVDFVNPEGQDRFRIRTYERGVEGETLACGSGAVAAALALGALGRVRSPVRVTPKSGQDLIVHFQTDGALFRDVYLEGEARLVYEGEMSGEAWQYGEVES